MPALDRPAEVGEHGDERVGDLLRAARGSGQPTTWPSTPSIKP